MPTPVWVPNPRGGGGRSLTSLYYLRCTWLIKRITVSVFGYACVRIHWKPVSRPTSRRCSNRTQSCARHTNPPTATRRAPQGLRIKIINQLEKSFLTVYGKWGVVRKVLWICYLAWGFGTPDCAFNQVHVTLKRLHWPKAAAVHRTTT